MRFGFNEREILHVGKVRSAASLDHPGLPSSSTETSSQVIEEIQNLALEEQTGDARLVYRWMPREGLAAPSFRSGPGV